MEIASNGYGRWDPHSLADDEPAVHVQPIKDSCGDYRIPKYFVPLAKADIRSQDFY